MAQFRAGGPAAPFFSSFTKATSDIAISDSVLDWFCFAMKKGLTKSPRADEHICSALEVLCSSSITITPQFFTCDPSVTWSANSNVKGEYRVDIAAFLKFSSCMFYPVVLGERKDGERGNKQQAKCPVARAYQCQRKRVHHALVSHILLTEKKLSVVERFAAKGLFPSLLFTIVKESFSLYGVTTSALGRRS